MQKIDVRDTRRRIQKARLANRRFDALGRQKHDGPFQQIEHGLLLDTRNKPRTIGASFARAKAGKSPSATTAVWES